MNISIKKKEKECLKAQQGFPLEVEIPNNIMIEVTNGCNLACRWCYHKCMKRKIGVMEFSLYKRIIDECVELGVENVGLYTTGESFLHPKIYEFIKYAKQRGIKYVYITTNGNALKEESIPKILESGLDSIKFSIDACLKETYEKYKVHARWEKLRKVVKLLRQERDKQKSSLKIFGSYVISKHNKDELKLYDEIWKPYIDETLFTEVNSIGGQLDEYKQDDPGSYSPCSLLWNRFIITYDGKLTICCVDFEASMIYADLNETTLRSAWNNDKIKDFRRQHKEMDFKTLPLCANCDGIYRGKDED